MIKLDRDKLELVHSVLDCVLDGVQVDNEYVIACKDYIESITPKVPKYKVGDLVFWKEKDKFSIIYDAIIVKLPDEYSRDYTIALLKYSVIRFVPENQLFLTFKEAKEAK